MDGIIATSAVTVLPSGESTVEIVTDGRVGSEADALRKARDLFDGPAFLSFRKSGWGELRFYFTNRFIDYTDRHTPAFE